MDWQQFVALAIVAVTTTLIVWSRIKGRRRGCGDSAACACIGEPLMNEARVARVGPRYIVSSREEQRSGLR